MIAHFLCVSSPQGASRQGRLAERRENVMAGQKNENPAFRTLGLDPSEMARPRVRSRLLGLIAAAAAPRWRRPRVWGSGERCAGASMRPGGMGDGYSWA